VPSEFVNESFVHSGVEKEKIRILHETLSPSFFEDTLTPLLSFDRARKMIQYSRREKDMEGEKMNEGEEGGEGGRRGEEEVEEERGSDCRLNGDKDMNLDWRMAVSYEGGKREEEEEEKVRRHLHAQGKILQKGYFHFQTPRKCEDLILLSFHSARFLFDRSVSLHDYLRLHGAHYVFLSVFKFEERKNWAGLIKVQH
jgi:hypothetical protein